MTKPKTCKTCVWWIGKKVEEHLLTATPTYYVHICRRRESPHCGFTTRDNDTCNKYESRDKQREMRLG